MIDLSSYIKVRCGTAAEWLTSTYKLGKAELGFDETNRFLKVGDGKTLWANLPVLGGNLGVTSFGGKQGDILLGAGLTMSGNTLTISSSGDNSVKYVSQTLTNEQKAQARTNIGAGTSSFDGDYNSLANKPTIPTKTSQLTNDSSFATTTQVGAKYTKPSGGIPKTDLATAVQNSLTAADNAVKYTSQSLTDAQKTQARTNIGAGTSNFSGNYNDLTNKPTIPTVNNGTLTLKAGSTRITFTANQSANVTFEVTAASLGALTASKSINTDNITAQAVSSGESTSGSGTINLHKVAKTGTYSDLIGVPTKLSQFTNDSGFTTNKGTVTHVKVNGTTYSPSSGVVDIGAVITAHQSLENYVTTDTEQTVTGAKTFTKLHATGLQIGDSNRIYGASDSPVVDQYLPAKGGTFAMLSDIPTVNNGTLTLKAGSNSKTFTANQSSAVTFEVTAANLGAVTQVKVNGVTKSPDSNGLVDLGTISGGGGSSATHEVTKLTNENLNNVKTVGWYSAAFGNSCTNRPSGVGSQSFSLKVDAYGANGIMQTIRSAAYISSCWVRFSDTGGSWSSWTTVQGVSTGSQTFTGTKTFSNQVTLNGPLATSAGSNISHYLLMSRGSTLSPMWVNLRVKINGTEYTPDDTGLIDLGTISGGTTTVMASTNLVY